MSTNKDLGEISVPTKKTREESINALLEALRTKLQNEPAELFSHNSEIVVSHKFNNTHSGS